MWIMSKINIWTVKKMLCMIGQEHQELQNLLLEALLSVRKNAAQFLLSLILWIQQWVAGKN